MPSVFDAAELTLKILSCIFRAEEKYGAYLIASCLCGTKSKKVEAFGLTKLSTYGIVPDLSTNQVIAVTHYLMHLGLIYRSTEHSNLRLTNKGKQFLKQKPPLFLPRNILNDAKIPLFPNKLISTHFETLKLLQNGSSIPEIAKLRNLKESTIAEHIADLVYHRKVDDISRLVSPEKQKLIQEVLAKNPDTKLKTIKEKLPEDISYGQIKIMVAIQKLNEE